MRRSRLLLLLLPLLAGCAPSVQRASLTPVYADVKKEIAEAPLGSADKLVFRSPHARVHVFSNDVLNGDHHFFFTPVRGVYRVERASGRARLHVEIGMRGLRAETSWITGFAARMLAVEEHPVTVLDARVEPAASTKRVVTGNIRLRGVERGIRFEADVADEGDDVRFRATFDMSRSEFGIRASPGEGDALIRDDFTVTLEFLASKERVVVEEVPEAPGEVEWPVRD